MWSSYCHKVILHSEKISLRGLKVSLSEKREKLHISPNQKVRSLWMSSVPRVVAVETQPSFQCWWYECPELFWALPICQVTCFTYATLSQQQPFEMAAVMIPGNCHETDINTYNSKESHCTSEILELQFVKGCTINLFSHYFICSFEGAGVGKMDLVSAEKSLCHCLVKNRWKNEHNYSMTRRLKKKTLP